MKVVAVRRKELDLTESVLAHGPFRERFLAQPESIEPLVKVTGSALFADDERLLPLVSSYLNRHYRNTILADPTVLSYGRRISCLLTYLNAKPEYRTCDRDDALLSVGLGHLEAYLSKLDSDGLASTTVRSRDTTYNHLFSKHLCKPFGTTPPLRADNPYEDGPLRPGSADTRGIIQPGSMAELEAVILKAHSERERCLLQAMYDSGLRVSEVPRITLQDIRDALAHQTLHLVSPETNIPINADYSPLNVKGSKGKKNNIKPRLTLMSRTSLERIEKYHQTPLYRRWARRYKSPAETPAFFNAEGTPFKTKSVEKLLERVCKRAMSAGRIKRMISPHKFRHGGAYLLLGSPDLGKNYEERLALLAKAYGHNSTTTSEGYTKIPHDIYEKLRKPGTELRTKAGEMKLLRERTTKRINASDKK